MGGGVIGRRRDDLPLGELPDDLRAGDYWKIVHADGKTPLEPPDEPKYESNLTRTCWHVAVPLGVEEGYGLANLMMHTVREHEDGTISVRPGDGSSNSILVQRGPNGPSWHGYIEHGELRSV